ncbi:MAG: hypothetical protein IPM69_14855 [Ignavibacteria bacterium]|nr:hypothetical protein [Ignavibacteria bacterium]
MVISSVLQPQQQELTSACKGGYCFGGGLKLSQIRSGLRGLSGDMFLGAGAIAGGGTPGATASGCAPCPTGCRTEIRKEVYHARQQRISPSDVAVKVSRKIVKCEDVGGVPKIACEQNAINGLRGLHGCSSCSGNHSDRM